MYQIISKLLTVNVFRIVLNSVISVSGSDTITILVGNKCDLEDKREVDEVDIRVSVPIRCQLNRTYTTEKLGIQFSTDCCLSQC